jgi:hypothetical protein
MPYEETLPIATVRPYYNPLAMENRAWLMPWRMRYLPFRLTSETLQRTRMAVSIAHTSSQLLNSLIFRHRFSTFGRTNL